MFSAVQPTGGLHLGNYLGAIKRFVPLQDDKETLFCVADLHAITLWQDPKDLQAGIRETASAFVACGLDPARAILFNQSQVSSHAELAWILNCVARIGWLNRMTQFKEKAGKNRENASVGLYCYPTLMAADILAYKSTAVPVGEDQKQHLELARDIAAKFNHDYEAEDFFPLPEPLILDAPQARVMSLRDGSSKMSKSDPSDFSRINLLDNADTIALKIRKARTDSHPLPSEIAGLASRKEAANLVAIFAALSESTSEQILSDYAGASFSRFKKALAELTVEILQPIGEKMRQLTADPHYIDKMLHDGAQKAYLVSRPILLEVYKIVGLASK